MTEPTERGGGGFRQRLGDTLWRRRSLRGKIFVVIGAVFLAFLLIGIFAPPPEEDADTNSPPVATTTEEAEAATTVEEEPEQAEEPAEAEDTGRMSDTEYEFFAARIAEVGDEIGQYGETLPKCSVLIRALELAETSECIKEAYSGLEEDILTSYAVAEDYEADVAKACLKALRLYKTRLDAFYTWISTMSKAGETLQFDEFNTLAARSDIEFKRYTQASKWVLTDCAPR